MESFLYSLILPLLDSIIIKYGAVFLISVSETLPVIGLLLPGATLIGLFGFLAAQGFFDLTLLFLFSTLGAVFGDQLAYYLGTKGEALFTHKKSIFTSDHLAQGKRFFQKYGSKSIFWGRMIGFLRPIIPFVAGIFKMNKKDFLFWNIVGGVCWSLFYIFLGYFFGHAFLALEKAFMKSAGIFLLLFIILWVMRKYLARYL